MTIVLEISDEFISLKISIRRFILNAKCSIQLFKFNLKAFAKLILLSFYKLL